MLVYGTPLGGKRRVLSKSELNSKVISNGDRYRCEYSLSGGELQKLLSGDSWKNSALNSIKDNIYAHFPAANINYIKFDPSAKKAIAEFTWQASRPTSIVGATTSTVKLVAVVFGFVAALTFIAIVVTPDAVSQFGDTVSDVAERIGVSIKQSADSMLPLVAIIGAVMILGALNKRRILKIQEHAIHIK